MTNRLTKINPNRLEMEYNLPKGYFHKKIKKAILKDARKKVNFKNKTGRNPDISLDKYGNIFLVSPGTKGITIPLPLKIEDFIQN